MPLHPATPRRTYKSWRRREGTRHQAQTTETKRLVEDAVGGVGVVFNHLEPSLLLVGKADGDDSGTGGSRRGGGGR